jgi:F-type H+-transporting ATPase subunit alpha
MKQAQYAPLSTAQMATSLFAATSGALDDVEVEKVVDFEGALIKYMNDNQADLMAEIGGDGTYNDDIAKKLTDAIADFKANHSY